MAAAMASEVSRLMALRTAGRLMMMVRTEPSRSKMTLDNDPLLDIECVIVLPSLSSNWLSGPHGHG